MERVSIGAAADFPVGSSRVVQQGNQRIAVFRRKETFHAVDDFCPHQGGSLSMGWCTAQDSVVCPLHGWEFRLSDGKGVWPEGMNVQTYTIEVEGEDVYLVTGDGGPASL